MSATLRPISPASNAIRSRSPATRLLSRSPHPYHHRSADLPDRFHVSDATPARIQQGATASKDGSLHERSYFNALRRKRHTLTTSPSDSGTEADDERSPLLKGLPAAPLRARKGLRRGNSRDASPGLPITPSGLDDGRSRFTEDSRPRSRPGRKAPAASDVDREHKRAQYIRRRRVEAIRRLCEALSLALIGFLIFRTSDLDTNLEFLCYISFIMLIYLSYGFCIIWKSRSARSGRRWPIHFPASSDPAPLLYPILLPVYVAVALGSADHFIILSNTVLSICALPSKSIPFSRYGLHWLFSLFPVILKIWITNGEPLADFELSQYHGEVLCALYPLHSTVLSGLGFLTTTSLLSAELQLLSVALINLLLFSASPQAIILKSLLWLGGISIFLLCRHVLKWAVSLARVPNWRFRRVSHHLLNGHYILHTVDDWLGGMLSRRLFSKQRVYQSESEDGGSSLLRKDGTEDHKSLGAMNGFPTTSPTLKKATTTDDLDRQSNPTVASDDLMTGIRSPRRRHTISSTLDFLPDSLEKLRSHGRAQLKKIRKKSFLSLTKAQASLLKWLYACYLYIVVIATIAVPIRSYISHRALYGHEPVGWALGYLFGDLPSFRLRTVLWNLEGWICLPLRPESALDSLCWGEHVRQVVIGAANTRIFICAYCLAIIIVGLTVVLQLSSVAEVDSRRKVFHGMMVAMFLPTIFIDPDFAALALILVLAIFLLLDLFRASQLPPLSKPVTLFLAPYVDGRDHRGPIIVSHIFLLIGCAIPLWLSLAATVQIGEAPFTGWDVASREVSMVSGVICVGMGDAAASLIGRRYGRRKWAWSGGKSLEGSLAFAVAVLLGLAVARFWLLLGGWKGDSGDAWSSTLGKAAIAACGASFTEAVVTGGNDNVIVPIILWLLVKGLKM